MSDKTDQSELKFSCNIFCCKSLRSKEVLNNLHLFLRSTKKLIFAQIFGVKMLAFLLIVKEKNIFEKRLKSALLNEWHGF